VTVNDELEICERKRSWPVLRYYRTICVEGTRNTTKYRKDGRFIELAQDCTQWRALVLAVLNVRGLQAELIYLLIT
jgi:hypothetical protein